MELAAGRLCEASDLAGRAILELRDAGLDLELDRARKLYVDIERRRLWFGEAAKAADQRVAAGLGGDGALLDAFLIRLELALAHAKDGDKALVAAAAAFPEGWGRDAATTIAAAVAAGTPRAAVKVPAGCPPRWKRLADVAAGTSDSAIGLAHHCGTEEPELRRWAAGRVDPKGGVVWVREAIEQRRGTDDAGVKGVIVADDDQAVLLVEPLADGLHVLVLRGRRPDLDFAVAKDDGGLAAFWDAVHVDPSAERLASAAKRVSSALFPDAVAKSLDGVKRLWISVSEPVGPLPFDLLPFGDGLLIDRFDVLTVKSAAELVRARARRAPPMLSALKSPDATLDARYEVVSFGAIGDAARMQIFLGVASRQAEGRDVAEALREAKLALRAETKDAPPAKGVPAWAALLLRGAP
jgi:hypothetical protein